VYLVAPVHLESTHHVDELVQVDLFALAGGCLQEVGDLVVVEFSFARLHISHGVKGSLDVDLTSAGFFQSVEQLDDAVGIVADGLVELSELPQTEHLVAVFVEGMEHDGGLALTQLELLLQHRHGLGFVESSGEAGLVLGEDVQSFIFSFLAILCSRHSAQKLSIPVK